MTDQTSYDIVIIGAGPAGYCAALRAAQLGFSTLVVEKGPTLGGTCLNVGCIPSKALLDSSERFAETQNGLAQHGITVGSVSLDLGIMMQRKDRVVATLTGGIESLFRQNRITVLHGTARFLGAREIGIDSAGSLDSVRAKRAIIIASEVRRPRLRLCHLTTRPWSTPPAPYRFRRCRSDWRSSGAAQSAWSWQASGPGSAHG